MQAKPLEIRIDSRVRFAEADVDDDTVEGLRKAHEKKNPGFFKMKRMGLKAWSEPPIIKLWRREGGELTFGRGSWSTVRDVLRANGRKFVVRDCREKGRPAPLIVSSVEARDYQDESIALFLEKEQGIIRVSTGGGKTTIGLIAAGKVGTCTLILCDNGGIAEEWRRRAREELGIEIGYIGKGRKDVRPITVALHQALHALKPEAFAAIDRQFGALVIDEVQVLGAKTYGENVNRLRARYRLGLSDDHHRSDGKTFLVSALMGEVLFKIGDKKLIKQGAIVDVDVFAEATDFRADWYSEIRGEDGERLPASGEEFNRLVDEMSDDPQRNIQIVDRAVERVSTGRRVLVFCHRERHVRALAAMLRGLGLRAGIMLGGTPEFEAARAELVDGRSPIAVGTLKALGKGINVPAVDCGIATTPVIGSQQTWRQVKGRIVRPKDRAAEMWVFWDRYVEGDRAIRAIKKWHRDRLRIAVGNETLTHAEYVRRMKTEK